MQYYFLATSFPSLDLHQMPEISFQQLHESLLENLSKADFALYRDFLLYIDLKNIKALIAEKSFDPRGYFSEKSLREALLTKEDLPEYLFTYLQKIEDPYLRLKNYVKIYSRFFSQKREGFLRKYFSQERDIRLILAALRAKKWNKSIQQELQFEDFSEPLVAYILVQKDAKEFEPPEGYKELKTLFTLHEKKPQELEKKLIEYRIKKIEDLLEGELFSIGAVLGYAVKLFLIESWWQLDFDQGKQTLNQLV